MLRKIHIIFNEVQIRNIKYRVILNRTEPGKFMCSSKCVYRDSCNFWKLPQKHSISDFCITYPRIPETLETRHYYYPHVIEKM